MATFYVPTFVKALVCFLFGFSCKKKFISCVKLGIRRIFWLNFKKFSYFRISWDTSLFHIVPDNNGKISFKVKINSSNINYIHFFQYTISLSWYFLANVEKKCHIWQISVSYLQKLDSSMGNLNLTNFALWIFLLCPVVPKLLLIL